MLLQQILDNCRRFPAKEAYRCGQGSLSYGELMNHALALARWMDKTLQNHHPALIYGHKQTFMPVCFLACIISGRAYVPADSGTPLPRLQEMAAQADCSLLLAVEELVLEGIQTLSRQEMQRVCDEAVENEYQPRGLLPQQLAYILFTSGSTGVPKGVKVPYAKVQSFVAWLGALPAIHETACETVLNQAAFSFDLSVADFYLALSTGATLFVLEKEVQQDYPLLFSRLAQSGAGIAVMTPSFAEHCLADTAFNSTLLPHLGCIFFCGETLHPYTVRRLTERFAGVRIINAYGPTEATVAVTAAEIVPDLLQGERLSLGYPKSGTDIIIVNEALLPMPEGETGQILIIGDSVAAGYTNGEAGGFTSFSGRPAYLTGDYGYLSGGQLYFCGRADTQVKRGGYRVELEDIENNLNSLSGVAQTAVVAEEKNGRQFITAFIQLSEGVSLTEAAARCLLAARLPSYMLPNRIRFVSSLPLTANGKRDRAGLANLLPLPENNVQV